MKKIKITPLGVEEIELSAEEISQRETDIANETARQEAEQTAKTQKEADALAGNNKLLGLGLSQAEVTAMTGYKPQA
jgi:DNA-binding PadR family transcriptional regulator